MSIIVYHSVRTPILAYTVFHNGSQSVLHGLFRPFAVLSHSYAKFFRKSLFTIFDKMCVLWSSLSLYDGKRLLCLICYHSQWAFRLNFGFTYFLETLANGRIKDVRNYVCFSNKILRILINYHHTGNFNTYSRPLFLSKYHFNRDRNGDFFNHTIIVAKRYVLTLKTKSFQTYTTLNYATFVRKYDPKIASRCSNK